MSTPADWAKAMQKAQADLMQQWTAFNSGLFPAAAAATPAAGKEGTPSGAPADDSARRFIGQFEQYLDLSRSLWELIGRSSTEADPGERLRIFNDGLARLQQQAAGLWMGATPGTLAMPQPGQGAAAAWAQIPAIGPTREQQELLHKLTQAGARLTQAQLTIGAQWNEIVSRALRDLGGKLGPRLQGSGALPGSMKELYDLWVNSAEATYAQAAHGAAFVSAQAELASALAQLRVAQRELFEEWARQFDLPTRAELNSVHQQLRELRAALQRQGGR